MNLVTVTCVLYISGSYCTIGFPEYMSFPRFRRRYECLVPSDERPHGIVDEKAVSDGSLDNVCLGNTSYILIQEFIKF